LREERDAVVPPETTSPSAWGIGFYQGDEVLHKKRPMLEGPVDWEELTSDVRTDCAVLHLRQATVGDFRIQNTHPFRMRSWTFAHDGTVERFDALRDRLLESIPDFLRRNIRGTTDSEVYFHLLLSFLHDAGQLDNPDVDESSMLSAVRSTVALIDRLGDEVRAPTSRLNMMLTSGRRMYALSRGAPIAFVARRGLDQPPEDRSTGEATVLRYVLVVSHRDSPPPGYEAIADHGLLRVDRNLDVAVHAL
jgi:glutamine amidotransferase